ncbi:CrcB family protein [Salmonella enterica]
MLKIIILVFFGGAFGAMYRELIMLLSPVISDKFPLDIFIANMVASLFIGLASGLFKCKRLNQYTHTFVTTGIMGGLSTFSSFSFGAVMMLSHHALIPWAALYVLSSLTVGLLLTQLGIFIGMGNFRQKIDTAK